jgi:anti-sigma factor RsiW
MLSCQDVTEKSSALIDGELGLRERLAIRMHLAMCRHCRRFVRHLRLLVGALHVKGNPPAEPPPAELVDRIMAEIDSAPNSTDSGA